jgi:hypothetical protein
LRAVAPVDAASVTAHDAADRPASAARNAMGAMLEGDDLAAALAAIRRVLKVEPINTVAARRRLAKAAGARKGYPLA